jgi:rubredoxin
MTCDLNPSALPRVFRCDECGFVFEEGIADPTPEGKARCPQCGLSNVREVNALEVEDFVLRQGMKVR